MKKTFLQRTPITWLLILFFSTILILLITAEFTEHKEFKQTQLNLNEITIKSLHRQQILTSILEQSVYTRVNTLNALLYPEKRLVLDSIVREKTLSNDQDYLEYQKLIGGPVEQELFNKIQLLRELNIVAYQNIQHANNAEQKQLSLLFENFQQANRTLADFVKKRDAKNIDKANFQLSEIEKLSRFNNIVLALMLTGLGIVIIRTVMIMRKKNWRLGENERKYRELTEQTNEIIEKCDANGKIIYANDSFKKRLEYSDDELSNLNLSDILLDKRRNLNKARPGLEDVITNVRKVFVSKSGKKIYLEGNILLEYKNKKFIGSTGFFNDITEKKQLEESLIASEKTFRSLFNLAPIPMWVIDSESLQFVLVNNAAIKHYGFSQEEFYKKSILDIRPEEDISKIKENITNWIKDVEGPAQQSNVYRGSSRHLKKSNELIEVEIYNTPIILNDKVDILSTAIDVTERNQNEHRITKAIIKAQEDERYEIGGELHDNVCQILAAAKMSLSMMKSSITPAVTGLYNQSQESIILATDEIRNLSHRLAPAFFENTGLEETFESLVRDFNVADSYDISLYFDNKVKEYSLGHDLQLNLYRILQEQLRNIIKYAKGTLIEVDVLLHNDKLKMRIADNGIGFNANEVNSGIGLSNMKRRAELFDGTIQIDSSPGNGCEVLVTIPVDGARKTA